jgi:hypothetical protein
MMSCCDMFDLTIFEFLISITLGCFMLLIENQWIL